MNAARLAETRAAWPLIISTMRGQHVGIRLLKSNGREGSLIDVARNAVTINHRSVHASQVRLMADAAGRWKIRLLLS